MLESFWPNIAEIMIICDKSKVYLKIWEKIVGSAVAEIIIKIWDRKDKWCDGRGRKNVNFGNLITEILAAQYSTH